MSDRIGPGTLMVIPCCKSKMPLGQSISRLADPLSSDVSPVCYSKILTARQELLAKLKLSPKFCTGVSKKEYEKNAMIREGPDFGGNDSLASYLPAIDRYCGKLYSVHPAVNELVRGCLQRINKSPKLLILSALYGPLHPLSEIQDYNLKMDDTPASQTWKKCLGPFLEEYIERNNISIVCLYLGTAYLKVAAKALGPLQKKGLQIIHYHIKDGNSTDTPLLHGQQFVSDLQRRTSIASSPRVEINRLGS